MTPVKTGVPMQHPAKYSDTLLPHFARLLYGYPRVLDPFAGTGKLRTVCPTATLLEIEPEWAALSGALVGDALNMPAEWKNYFDAVCTSPTYGNRMADHFTDHQPDKRYRRNTYTHVLGRKLDPRNSGQLQWGPAYQQFHVTAWGEVWRVLRPGGRFVLNVSDHIRNGQRVPVSAWHVETLIGLGFNLTETIEVCTPRQRYGQNGTARVEVEYIFVFEKADL